ncbi:MAG: hypothetical protein WCA39_11205 [Nitrososphaeraceae archaeon]
MIDAHDDAVELELTPKLKQMAGVEQTPEPHRQYNNHPQQIIKECYILKSNNNQQDKLSIFEYQSERKKIAANAKQSGAQYYCQCHGSEPSKIKIDPSAHEPACWVRKKLTYGLYTTNTSIAPPKIDDGYSLGVPLND